MITQENIEKELSNWLWNPSAKFKLGFFNGAIWANDQNAQKISELEKELAHIMEEVDSMRIGRDRLQGEISELLAALQAVKTEKDEHRADVEDWVYNSIVEILKKYDE